MLILLLCNEDGRQWIKFNLQQCEVLLLETLLKGYSCVAQNTSGL